MLNAFLVLLLPMKHFGLAHVFDLGYSQSRSREGPWVWSLMLTCLAELAVSACLLYGLHAYWLTGLLLLEGFALVFVTALDRKTNLATGLKVHLVGELGLYLMYVAVGIFVYKFLVT